MSLRMRDISVIETRAAHVQLAQGNGWTRLGDGEGNGELWGRDGQPLVSATYDSRGRFRSAYIHDDRRHVTRRELELTLEGDSE